ncbi:hypothetical protein [Bacteroides sp.]|uniref:hypothetical protein n=1 Tax=Bacteroides sp. TaxID=29523 RepID=UPI0026137072|nr:hypothetical protein [Bacteroides sp.]MDD3039353.1 hypothetical protein [Bacteroides sp.]
MKRTTYILIGLFIAGLIVLVGGILMMFLTGRPYGSDDIVLRGEQVEKEFPPCKVIWLTQTVIEEEGHMVWMGNSSLEILPSEAEKNILSYPKGVNDYLTMKVAGDTLKISFDYPIDKLADKFEKQKYLNMHIGDWQLRIPPSVETIISDMRNQQLSLKSLSQDSLVMNVSVPVSVEDCNFTAFNVLRCGRNLELKSGNVHNLYLSLDYINDWSVNVGTCKIDTEYLKGKNGNVYLAKGECKRLFWIPEKKDSELRVTLSEKSCITVME